VKRSALKAPGIEVAGSASVFPLDLGCGSELGNEDVYRELFGRGYAAELECRGWRPDHPETAWGVRRRQWLATPGRPETARADAADLALAAARAALGDAGLLPGDIELVIVATSTPPRLSSTIASRVGRELGIEAPCIDQRAGGAGGLVAWITASMYLRAGLSNALVVGTEALSPVLDPTDLANALLFGDGAAALVLKRCEDEARGLVCARMGNADVGGRAFTVPGALPPTVHAVEAGGYVLQSPDKEYGHGLAELRTRIATDLGRDAAECGLAIDVALPYAVTLPQARAQADAMGVPLERIASGLSEHGCLGAAAPLVAMSEAAGGVVGACAAGGGVAWATLLWVGR